VTAPGGRAERPAAIVNSVAPIRICDNGCWTDTWFAGHGRVFNVAVYPYAEVQVAVYRAEAGRRPRAAPSLVIHAENFGQRYELKQAAPPWGPHPLLEAAIAYMKVPKHLRLELTIHSEAPAGAGTGTSAAVSVALVGALDALVGGRLTTHEVATAAQRVETEMLHRQCGIQDQLASAYGGVNYIEMSAYPDATVSRLALPDPVWWELERRLLLVYLGKSHDSSAIHESVIRSLESAGPDSPALATLRATAVRSRDAIGSGDFAALGRAMTESTEAQGRLHAALVGAEASRVIEIARAHGALGWKVNGAGGDGGSLTLLCDEDSSRKRALVREIEQDRPAFRQVPIYLSRHGLRVWRQDLG
jgi:D-glycero-alpha-D-manno-heptose-7-phosphate kinase